ncbi:hypothetical protein [Fodinibius sp. SL11]|uniref:hypothetical protein n=1 Tax=Fodinibius sp. SL11 TaxID=3425690 RepID=UPI003F882AE7
MGLLLIGAVIFLLNPINQSDYATTVSGLPLYTEANVSTYVDDIDLPVGEQADDKNDLSKLSLSEGADKKEPDSSTNKLVIVNQVHSYSFLPVERASVDAIVYDTRHTLIQEVYRTLLNRLSSFAHHSEFAPLISGIAINAPPVFAFN